MAVSVGSYLAHAIRLIGDLKNDVVRAGRCQNWQQTNANEHAETQDQASPECRAKRRPASLTAGSIHVGIVTGPGCMAKESLK